MKKKTGTKIFLIAFLLVCGAAAYVTQELTANVETHLIVLAVAGVVTLIALITGVTMAVSFDDPNVPVFLLVDGVFCIGVLTVMICWFIETVTQENREFVDWFLCAIVIVVGVLFLLLGLFAASVALEDAVYD